MNRPWCGTQLQHSIRDNVFAFKPQKRLSYLAHNKELSPRFQEFSHISIIIVNHKHTERLLGFLNNKRLWPKSSQPLCISHTCDLITLPLKKDPIYCKWIYKIMHRSGSSIEWYNTQLAHGFAECGVNYEDVFTAMIRTTIVRQLIYVIVALSDLHPNWTWRMPLFRMTVLRNFKYNVFSPSGALFGFVQEKL